MLDQTSSPATQPELIDGKMKSVDEEKKEILPLDPELDFTSSSFDPYKALQAESIYLPCIDAKTYNNLAEYTSHITGKHKNRHSKVEKN